MDMATDILSTIAFLAINTALILFCAGIVFEFERQYDRSEPINISTRLEPYQKQDRQLTNRTTGRTQLQWRIWHHFNQELPPEPEPIIKPLTWLEIQKNSRFTRHYRNNG